jgi:hypothetical protein
VQSLGWADQLLNGLILNADCALNSFPEINSDRNRRMWIAVFIEREYRSLRPMVVISQKGAELELYECRFQTVEETGFRSIGLVLRRWIRNFLANQDLS